MTHDEIMNLNYEQLDYEVAVAHGWWVIKRCGVPHRYKQPGILIADYHPSRDGNQLLELMHRESISVTPCAPNLWESEKAIRNGTEDIFYIAHGNTINQAVLRCYLLSKLPPKQA